MHILTELLKGKNSKLSERLRELLINNFTYPERCEIDDSINGWSSKVCPDCKGLYRPKKILT